jgi:hypothetical protein
MSTLKEQHTTVDLEKHDSYSLEAGDVALGVFEDLGQSNEAVDDSKLRWKIDMRLMPLM